MPDFLLLITILVFSFVGYKRGFVKSLVGMSTTIISMLLSMLLYRPVAVIVNDGVVGEFFRELAAEKIADTYGDTLVTEMITQGAAQTFSMIASSVVSFVVLGFLVKIIVAVLAHGVDFVSKIPILKQVNSLLGLALGFISGLLILYIVIGLIATVSYSTKKEENTELNSIEKSYFASMFYEDNLICDVLTGADKTDGESESDNLSGE